MAFFSWIRDNVLGKGKEAKEHLESHSRIGQQVYVVYAELKHCGNPRALAYAQAARSFQTMADALLGQGFANSAEDVELASITKQLADEWYGKIPELLVAARQEAAFSNSSAYVLPVMINRSMAGSPRRCPDEHLAGLRRAASGMERLVADDAELARLDGRTYKSTILYYEAARTHKEAGDMLAGSLGSRGMPDETIEDAAAHYWKSLFNYVLVAQGLKYPEMINGLWRCKLDSDDVWKVTAKEKIIKLKMQIKFVDTAKELKQFWNGRPIQQEEREYECTVEELLQNERITKSGYWYKIPYPYTYRVNRGPVIVFGHNLPQGHEFVYEYGEKGALGTLITRGGDKGVVVHALRPESAFSMPKRP